MAFQSHRTRFQGELNGITLAHLGEYDNNKDNYEERLEFIKNKYETVEPFYNKYTDEYYKPNLNVTDNLSEDINIFQLTERDGTYLLNSSDIPREKQYKYKLLSQKEFNELLKREKKIDIQDEDISSVLKPASKNFHTNLDLKITSKDLAEDSEMGEKLRDYDKLKNHMKEEALEIRNGNKSYLKLYQIKSISGSVKSDMLDVKRSYKGIRRPTTRKGDESGMFYTDNIDYSNPSHIKAILTICPFGEIEPNNELSHFAYDMSVAVDKLASLGKLDSKDLEIVEGVNLGVSMDVLGEELQISKQAVSKRLDKITEKIANFFNKTS